MILYRQKRVEVIELRGGGELGIFPPVNGIREVARGIREGRYSQLLVSVGSWRLCINCESVRLGLYDEGSHRGRSEETSSIHKGGKYVQSYPTLTRQNQLRKLVQ